MRYAPKGFCLNDFEIIPENDLYHLFHLQGPPVMPFDADRLETSYGHAISRDLIRWETQAPVFGISDPPHFDDSAVWTMSVTNHHDKRWMFYTGLTREPRFLQQIGLAIDETGTLQNWKRFSEKPLVSASPRWYQTTGFMAWRDPFVIFDDETRQWIMYVCAKTLTGDSYKQGCIGCAVSTDLTDWTVREPVLSPGIFSEMECPVLFKRGPYWYLFISMGDDRKIHAYRAEHALGPFEYLGPIAPAWNYAPRIVTAPNGETVLLHTVPRKWQAADTGEYMRGKIAQPKTLHFDPHGVPYLTWYSPVENHYEDVLSPQNHDGNLLLTVSDLSGTSGLSVKMRMPDDSEKAGIELIGSNDRLVLRYIEDACELASMTIPQNRTIEEIKIIAHDEYYEIYCDDILAMTALGYRHVTGKTDCYVNGKQQEYRLKRFIDSPYP